jgi:hypothetical protein
LKIENEIIIGKLAKMGYQVFYHHRQTKFTARDENHEHHSGLPIYIGRRQHQFVCPKGCFRFEDCLSYNIMDCLGVRDVKRALKARSVFLNILMYQNVLKS